VNVYSESGKPKKNAASYHSRHFDEVTNYRATVQQSTKIVAILALGLAIHELP